MNASPLHAVSKISAKTHAPRSRTSLEAVNVITGQFRPVYAARNRSIVDLVDEVERICGDLAQKVIELRLARGLTQEALAERAGLDARNLRRIERSGDARVQTLVRIALALDVSVAELFLPPSQKFRRGPGRPPRSIGQGEKAR